MHAQITTETQCAALIFVQTAQILPIKSSNIDQKCRFEEVSKYDQERHEMEEKRKEEAIGGVYGSPYWVKQLYLGYAEEIRNELR